MGIDPLSIKFIRLAHERGLGCGDPRDIEIVGDVDAAQRELALRRPVQRDDVRLADAAPDLLGAAASKPIEWSLKTVLAPWAYVASVLYHDSFWYPLNADRRMRDALNSPWGRLFQNWETLTPDANGFPTVGDAPADAPRLGRRALGQSVGILGTCIKEAPEFASRRRHATPASKA